MRKKLISMLVLLAAVATGAVAQETYKVSVKEGTEDATSWTIAPAEATTTGVAAGTTVTATYSGSKKVKSVKAVKKAPTGTTVDLSTLTGAYEAQDGDVLTGTLPGNYKISIADGATVTLDGVTINGVSSSSYPWAGITCVGDATIILKESSENTVTGFYNRHPGIFIPAGKTLTIKGDGALVARSSGSPAQTPGIGGAYASNGGNIIIEGGTITATGGNGAAGIGGHGRTSFGDITITGGTITASSSGSAAGIGSGGQSGSKSNGRCGNITITGGTITATGGANGAGIGAGQYGECGAISISGGTINATGGSKAAAIGCGGSPSGGGSICGDITIANTVTKVTAIKGSDSPYSIGKGWDDYNKAVCGTVTIGGVVGAITESPFTYDPSAPAPAAPALNITSPSVGQVIGSDGKNYAYGSLPTGVTAVAMIAKVSGTSGLAIALDDEDGTMNWDTAVTTAAAHTPTFTGGTWRLPTPNEWTEMFAANGDEYNCSGLNTAIKTAGGTALQMDAYYWSSTEEDGGSAYAVFLDVDDVTWDSYKKDKAYRVRACLVF